jgi:hypothetical protein
MGRSKKNLEGMRFGRLVVVEYSGKRHALNYWICKCDCGKLTKAGSGQLVAGRKKSCGCLRNEFSRESIKKIAGWSKKPYGEANKKNAYKNYKYAAQRKSLDFSVSLEEFSKISKDHCFYCGKPPSDEYGTNRCNGKYVGNGMDRIDSSKGYVLSNVVPCCRICNFMKNVSSVKDFYDHISKLFNNLKRKGFV